MDIEIDISERERALAKIAEDVGFKVKRVTVCRTANTSGQQLKVYPYLRLLLRESIVTLIK